MSQNIFFLLAGWFLLLSSQNQVFETRLLMRNQLLLSLHLTSVSSRQGQHLHLCIYEAAVAFTAGHSFLLSAHKSSVVLGIEQSGGRLWGWNGLGGFLTVASPFSAFISFCARLFISISEAQKFAFFCKSLILLPHLPPTPWRPPACHTLLSAYCLSFIAALICLITLRYQSNLTANAFWIWAKKKKTHRQWWSCILCCIHMFSSLPPYLMMNMNGQGKWDDDIFVNTCVWRAAADDNNNSNNEKNIFPQFLPVYCFSFFSLFPVLGFVWFHIGGCDVSLSTTDNYSCAFHIALHFWLNTGRIPIQNPFPTANMHFNLEMLQQI